MSYLNFPRLTFSGEFQADVSTVNNDPRHFDNSTFEPYFQDFQIPRPDGNYQFNGWWNPVGTGIFRLSECKVNALLGPDGTPIFDPSLDAAAGCLVGNSPDRPSGKLVDLDPDWQLASCIYGLTVSLTDVHGNIVMQGNYQPNPFRDLWFNRAPKPLGGDTRASAMFQSVLTDVKWCLDGIKSPFFHELKKASEKGRLSIRLTTYGFLADNTDPKFGYGKVVGVIGPAYAEEPRSFILGRRFMPTALNPNTGNTIYGNNSSNGITCFSSSIDQSSQTLQVDLSNALPLDTHFKIQNLGALQFAVLKNPSAAQGDAVGPDDYISMAALDCSQSLQELLSGIQSIAIPDTAMALIADHPLALLQLTDGQGNATVCIMEAPLGLEVRAEQFTFRLDPNDEHANHAETLFYATQYGKPIANPKLSLTVNTPTADVGDCPDSVPADTTPQAAIPVNNVPAQAIRLKIHEDPVANQAGKVRVSVHGPDFFGTPREYLDGQLFSIAYNFGGNNQAVQQQFDCLATLLFSTFKAPAKPTWADVQPILQQYANLYPVMSQGLFDFSKQEQADANAFIMHFVFNKHIDDPDYMPVTRDLSASKRKMLLDYFAGVMKSSKPISDAQQIYATRCPMGFGRQSEK